MEDIQKRAIGALIFRMPEAVSWNIQESASEVQGDNLESLLEHVRAMPRGQGLTLSLTCLVEIEATGTGRS